MNNNFLPFQIKKTKENFKDISNQVDSLESSLAQMTTQINGLSVGGVLTFSSITDLQNAYPSGVSVPVWITSESAWYYWNGSTDTTAPTVTISPVAGTYTSTQSVTLTANETATIYYTTDGSTPTTSSSVYSSPISISTTTTLKYFAKDTAGNSSSVQSATYTISAGADTTPPVLTITPSATFTNTQTVTMSTNETATIWYTVDGTDPTTSGTKVQYSSPVTLTATTTVKAYAVDTVGNPSAVQTVTYTLQTGTVTTYVSDTFDRADNTTSLGTASDTGQTWEVLNGSVWGISANQARVYTDGSPVDAAVIDSAQSTSIAIEASHAKANTNMGLVFRCTDGSNFFYLVASSTGATLTKREAGVASNLLTITGTAPTANDVWRVELSGQNITIKQNGTQVGSLTHTFNQTATKHGMFTIASTSRAFDNFKVTSL